MRCVTIRRRGVWRLANTRHDKRNVVPDRHSGRVTKCYWAWCNGFGAGSLVEIDRTLDRFGYIRILEDVLLRDVEEQYPAGEVVYIIEDNSGVHRSRLVNEWYAAHPRLQRIGHPSKSPDLNWIENVWAEMVRLRVGHGRLTRLELSAKVWAAWFELHNKPELFRKLAESMPQRLQEVVESNGSYTHY
ncbi:hypothetical protein TKK_0003394 [Trichogramma kaykai]